MLTMVKLVIIDSCGSLLPVGWNGSQVFWSEFTFSVGRRLHGDTRSRARTPDLDQDKKRRVAVRVVRHSTIESTASLMTKMICRFKWEPDFVRVQPRALRPQRNLI
jgi:hypothetical protein